MTSNKGFGEVRIAARLRDTIRAIALNVVDTERPDFKIGAVWSYEDDTQMVNILFAGETSESLVRVRAGANMMPRRAMTDNAPDNTAPCDIVRVAGRPGQYWIIDYVSGIPRYASDTKVFYIDDLDAVPFENGWQNYGSPYAVAGYYRLNGRVHLQGLIKLGTDGTNAFTLPEEFWPADGSLIFTGITNSLTTGAASAGTAHTHAVAVVGGRIDVTSVGLVNINTANATGYISLSGISFRAVGY